MVDFEKYRQNFKKRSTSALISKYHSFNSEYRGYARQELKKRKVPKRLLPWKARTTKKRNSMGLNPFNFKW